ncbi:competence type IV pilus minor pilin ComGD [Bacillus sp. 2205SS5-2]|uniref:competence type IV pilus minor pilin ComGD n=1 Tax=Bacillus sp. 2205SS5-2 TaxID=3109031 RepID=UPI003006405A
MKLRLLNSQSAFTFVETLLVLLILSFFLSLSMFSFQAYQIHAKERQFMLSLKTDLLEAHTYAIYHQTSMTVQFYGTKYQAKSQTGELLFVRELPEGIKRLSSSSLKEITFYSTGNTNRFGSVVFEVDNQKITATFFIGQGRFYVEKR